MAGRAHRGAYRRRAELPRGGRPSGPSGRIGARSGRPVGLSMHTLASGSVPLPGVLNSLTGPLDHYGYWAIALLLLLENIGVPVVPGEFAMIGGAIFAGTGRAGLNVVLVGVVSVLVSIAGAQIGYVIGRSAGRELILRY